MSEHQRGRYRRSEALLERALRSIPLGAQTFSKSHVQYPLGAAPLFLERGRGARVWDVDGNEYVDLVNGLLCVLLGYGDPDVDAAVRAQLERGVSFSLSTPLEAEVAERIVRLVPCAERVRFAKNGSDATAGAVRLARAHTGRERVAVCGYHGWQDWYIGSTTRADGVPAATRALTHTFPYGDADALADLLARHPGGFAAVVLEPMNVRFPPEGWLAAVRDVAHEHGALLVFDEIVTGFRLALGGAQELFGVTPDLATLGKGLANGLPLAAVVGRADVMRGMEEIFFSTTFGGEALSLAAAAAVLDKLEREPVLPTLHARGARLAEGTRERAAAHGLGGVLRVEGHPAWSFLTFAGSRGHDAAVLKTFFLQEVLERGVLTLGTHNPSYALAEADVDHVLGAHDEALAALRSALDAGRLVERLRCEVLRPLFAVR